MIDIVSIMGLSRNMTTVGAVPSGLLHTGKNPLTVSLDRRRFGQPFSKTLRRDREVYDPTGPFVPRTIDTWVRDTPSAVKFRRPSHGAFFLK